MVHAALVLITTGILTFAGGDFLERRSTQPTEDTIRRIDEESERLKQLFDKLDVEPRLQADNHPRSLPELYQSDPEGEGKFVRRDNHLLINFDHEQEEGNNELIWIIYLPEESRYYVEHRFERNDPNRDRLFGPYEGNPYELLPELEEDLKKRLKSGDSNATVRMRRMIRQRHPDLTARVARLIDYGLGLEMEITEKNRLVDSLQRIVEANADAFSGEVLEVQLAAIQKQIQAFEQKVDALTMEIPENQYIVIEKAHQVGMPEEIDDALWGEPVDGLRFAVVPETKTLKFKEIVKVTLIVENVGDSNIKICVHDLVQDVRPDITFDGKRVFTQTTWFSGWPPTNRYLIKPGDRFSLAQSSLSAFQSSRPETAQDGFGVTAIPVKALQFGGAMRVDYTLRIGAGEAWARGEDGVMRVYSPAKGEWKGALKAGGFEIEFRR